MIMQAEALEALTGSEVIGKLLLGWCGCMVYRLRMVRDGAEGR